MSVAVDRPPDTRRATRAARSDIGWGLALAAALALLAFTTTGGEIGAPDTANTWSQIIVVLGAGVIGGLLLLTGARARPWGASTLGLFAALAVLTFVSVAWSVQPAASWIEGNGTLSYLAVFAIGLALARLTPARWPALIGGLAIYTTLISVYALVTKVFPDAFGAAGNAPRLRAPFDYFNAVGLVAALGLPAWLWLAAGPWRCESLPARRLLRVVAIPALAALVCALVLSYGRGAIVAAVIGLGVWFALVPARLRGALVLACGTLGGVIVSVWASERSSLTGPYVSTPARVSAGHSFGLVLLLALAVLVIAGVVVAIGMERVELSPLLRRRVGTALLVALALVPVAGVVLLAASSRGLTGEVSHLWHTLTSPKSVTFENPSRLGDLGSSRPRYWGDGLKVGEHSLLAGSGAFGFATACKRYNATGCVPDAHSYLVQTFADLGLIGVALSLSLLVAWALAVRRTLSGRAGSGGHVVERAGLATLLSVVVMFGIHSTIDWTWFIPGVAMPSLLLAGWLAGRGPVGTGASAVPRPRRLTEVGGAPFRAAAALGLFAVALLCAWMIWQPQRSADAVSAAVNALSAGNGGAALSDARTAVSADPVDLQARETLSAVYRAIGDLAAARAELVQGTSEQPSNPESWRALAAFDYGLGHLLQGKSELARALALEFHPSR